MGALKEFAKPMALCASFNFSTPKKKKKYCEAGIIEISYATLIF